MIINRDLTPYLRKTAAQFPAIALMGPRQSGKTTLAKATFPDYTYISLEELDHRAAAQEDPRGFLAKLSKKVGVIIDEVQEVPELFSYLQGVIDQNNRPGFFILTGSQNFLLHEKITQSLAGRIALFTLLPLSAHELAQAKQLPTDIESLLVKGCYPRLYAQQIDTSIWCSNYISTYVEKDVRQVLKISDVLTFQRFLKLCAARVGNIINYAELARDADISQNTAKAWLSVLETSYLIKILAPYYKNFSKRIIKSPKLYFYDTALACALLGIKTPHDLDIHPLRGALFESFVISELFKYTYNHQQQENLFFWRDVQGHEVDVIIEKTFDHLVPLEIKSGMTINPDFFKGVIKWKEICKQPTTTAHIVYGGNEIISCKNGDVWSWKNIEEMMQQLD